MPTGSWWELVRIGIFLGIGLCIAYGILQLALIILSHARPI